MHLLELTSAFFELAGAYMNSLALGLSMETPKRYVYSGLGRFGVIEL